MNTVTVTGRIATIPVHRYRAYMNEREFDLDVNCGLARTDRFRVVALNQVAIDTHHLTAGDRVAVNGYLRSDAVETSDGGARHAAVIVAYDIEVLAP